MSRTRSSRSRTRSSIARRRSSFHPHRYRGERGMHYRMPASVPRSWSTSWWKPRSFLSAVERSNRQISSVRFFNDPSQAIRARHEAYVAALFSTILSDHNRCTFLRLEAGQFPDFHLRTAERDLDFEITEADRIGRRRGLEYRARRRVRRYDPVEDEEQARRVIPLRVAEKAAKKYRPAPYLLIYVNLSTFARQPDTDSNLAESVLPWAKNFGAIWLLWGGFAIQLTPKLEKLTAQRDPFDH
jgi:hypothetical protein